MVRIAISQATFGAIVRTLPVGSVGENKVDENGERLVWLPRDVIDKLNHLRLAAWERGA
jgi:hypothetical protein